MVNGSSVLTQILLFRLTEKRALVSRSGNGLSRAYEAPCIFKESFLGVGTVKLCDPKFLETDRGGATVPQKFVTTVQNIS